jgi:hypothetical protein
MILFLGLHRAEFCKEWLLVKFVRPAAGKIEQTGATCRQLTSKVTIAREERVKMPQPKMILAECNATSPEKEKVQSSKYCPFIEPQTDDSRDCSDVDKHAAEQIAWF